MTSVYKLEVNGRSAKGEGSSPVNKFVQVLVSCRPGYGRHSKYAMQTDREERETERARAVV